MKEILISLKERIWNKGSILAIAGLVISLLIQFGFEIESEKIMGIITTICSVLIALGVLNDPTTGTKGYIPGISDKLVGGKEEVKVEQPVEPVVEEVKEVVEPVVEQPVVEETPIQ